MVSGSAKCHLGLFLCLDRLGLGLELKNVQFSRCERFWGVKGGQEGTHLAGENECGTNTFKKVRQWHQRPTEKDTALQSLLEETRWLRDKRTLGK